MQKCLLCLRRNCVRRHHRDHLDDRAPGLRTTKMPGRDQETAEDIHNWSGKARPARLDPAIRLG
jgi:hypothetical protein